MSDDRYRDIPYVTHPRIQTHPDRLAAVATFFGMTPAPLRQCRMLEIGCGDGSNLIPIACALPESQFTGVDLAERAIAAGNDAIDALDLQNIALQTFDLRDLDGSHGEFDYIVAHGVYSWVSAEVRDRLLAICGSLLTPQGVAMVSYNTYPGGYARQYLREWMLYHTRETEGAGERIEHARSAVKSLMESGTLPPAWQAFLASEGKTILERAPDSLFHDELEENNTPVYLRDFVSHAARHGLQYLGDGEPHIMFDPAGKFDWVGGERIEREQYLDFLRARSFRYTLLCREGVPLRHEPPAESMRKFLFSSPARHLEDGRIQGMRGICITSAHEAVYQVASALGETFPLPLAFEDLVPYAGSEDALQEILFGLTTGGFADFHVFDFPCEESVTEKPAACELVRYQASRSPLVTNACHQTVQLDDVARHLVLLMNGTRDHDRLARDLAAIPGAPALDTIREHLPGSLQWLAGMALLVG